MEATKMSGQLCLCANQALTIASQILVSASLNLGSPNEISISISADTIHTTLRAYVKIFVDAADAAHGRTVSRNTATSFLGALSEFVRQMDGVSKASAAETWCKVVNGDARNHGSYEDNGILGEVDGSSPGKSAEKSQ
jgi:hypothetical protein